MSLNPDIRDQAYQFFIEEAQELLQVLEDGLLNLKNDHSTSKVHELMRAAHSIKGGAASVELDTIKLIAHRLEDFFKALYSEKVQFDTQLETLLLQAYDGLREPLNQQMETGSFDQEAALLNVEPVFDELAVILGDALQEADSYIPSATDLGVDIVASIFEIDVQQSLDHLATLLNNPQGFNLVTEFQEQLEVLGGFAELFTLPGFTNIIELGQSAIANYPEKAPEILAVFLKDCQQARDLILQGDREQGGEASPELIAISDNPIAANSPNETNPDLLNALNFAAIDFEEPLETEEFSSGLENLFGGDLVTSTNSEVEVEQNSDLADIDNVFGESLTNNFNDKEIPNIFDFANEKFENSDNLKTSENLEFEANSEEEDITIFDFHDLPSTEVESDSFTSEENWLESDHETALENVFGEFTEDNILEIGEKILNGEIEQPVIEPQFKAEKQLEDNLENAEEEQLTSSKTNNQLEFAPPQNLDAALESISDIFEQLPEAKTDELVNKDSIQSVSSKTKKAQSTAKQNVALPNQLSVRVDLERLERMNNLIGELVINRNSLSLQNEQLQSNVKDLIKKFASFRSVTNKLRAISDKMLSESSVQQLLKLSNSNYDSIGKEAIWQERGNFDSLEMDSYNQVQLLLQDILEEILQLEESVEDISLFAQQSDYSINTQRQMLAQMRDELMWARMLPLEQILKRFPRTLRDLSNQYQKPVNLNLIGTEVLVDKAVLEKLYDPLLHLLRNGFDHGIETPDIRKQKGKAETGQIEIKAYYQGDQTIIEVKDDGQGLDLNKIAKKAINKGLIERDDLQTITPEDLFNLIFEPGFSTAEQVSEISGRGVGMSVVREQIESLKGTISVSSQPDKGSTFTLALPLTLTIAKLLVLSLRETAFALPSDSIEEIIIPLPEQIKLSGGQRFLHWQDQLVSIYNLQSILQYNCSIIPFDSDSKIFDSVNAPSDWALPLLLLRRGQQFFALEIDRLITEQELVIKPFGKTLNPPSYTYGCTILGDGTLIPVLNGITLINQILGNTNLQKTSSTIKDFEFELNSVSVENIEQNSREITSIEENKLVTNNSSIKQQTIMVVDDSTALRKTMALSLERQGYYVLQAKDGRDALEQLRKNSQVDLIVCDVEMPHMNGFEFLGVRRRDSEIKKIPVIMLTSRSGIKHRNLATQLGANGYFTKPYVEQEFSQEIVKILKLNNQNKSRSESNKNTKNVSKITQKITILIVDDSSALRKTMALSLENKGYRVLEARDGEEGIKQMQQDNIALVICDIEMPKMDGFGLLNVRRQDPKLQKIPVAMLTSRNSEKHQSLANKLGANAYFTKPYVEATFILEIEKLIKQNELNN